MSDVSKKKQRAVFFFLKNIRKMVALDALCVV